MVNEPVWVIRCYYEVLAVLFTGVQRPSCRYRQRCSYSHEATCSSIYRLILSNSFFPVCTSMSATIAAIKVDIATPYRKQIPYMLLLTTSQYHAPKKDQSEHLPNPSHFDAAQTHPEQNHAAHIESVMEESLRSISFCELVDHLRLQVMQNSLFNVLVISLQNPRTRCCCRNCSCQLHQQPNNDTDSIYDVDSREY